MGPATADALLDRHRGGRVARIGSWPRRCSRDEKTGATCAACACSTPRRGARGRRYRTDFEELGAIVERITLYRSVMDGGARTRCVTRCAGGADLVTFTSASAVNAFVNAVGEAAALGAPAASIGPITSDAARDAGMDVVVEATESTVPGLADAIAAYFTPPPRARA